MSHSFTKLPLAATHSFQFDRIWLIGWRRVRGGGLSEKELLPPIMTWKIVKHKIQFAKKLAEWKRTSAPHHNMENTKFELSLQFAKKLADWKMQLSGSWGQPCLLCCVVLCCVVLHCAVLYCVMCYWLQVSPALLQSRLAANLQWWALAAASCTPDSRLQVYNLQFTIFPNLRITI